MRVNSNEPLAPAVCVRGRVAGRRAGTQRRTSSASSTSSPQEWVRRDPDLATATRYFSGAEQDRLEQQLTPNTRAWSLERIALAKRGLTRARQLRHREAGRVAAHFCATDALAARLGRARRAVHGLPLPAGAVRRRERAAGRDPDPAASARQRKRCVKLRQAPRTDGPAHGRVAGRGEAHRRAGHDPAGVHHQDHARLDAHVPRRAGRSRTRW